MATGILLLYLVLFSLGCGGAVSLGIFYKCLGSKVLKLLLFVFMALLLSLLRNIIVTLYQSISPDAPVPAGLGFVPGLALSLLLYGGLFLLLLNLKKMSFSKAFYPTLAVLLVQFSRLFLYYFFCPEQAAALYLPSIVCVSAYILFIGLALLTEARQNMPYSQKKLLRRIGLITVIFSPASTIFYTVWFYTGLRQIIVISLDFIYLFLWSLVAIISLLDYIARMGRLPDAGKPELSIPESYGLTVRETEVLTELMKGLTNKEIGEKLFISALTVRTHVSRLIEKTGVRNRVELVAKISRQ